MAKQLKEEPGEVVEEKGIDSEGNGNEVARTSAPKRGSGAKEVIPLAWKLVGTSAGTPVTLLKCIDRKDAEAQMARLQSDGYYKDLEIYRADEKVPLSAALSKAQKQAIEEAVGQAAARKSSKASVRSEPRQDRTAAATKNTKSGRDRAATRRTPATKASRTASKSNKSAATRAKSDRPSGARSTKKGTTGKGSSKKNATPKTAKTKRKHR